MQKELITFPDGTTRYVASKLRIGASVDDRESASLLGEEYIPEPNRHHGPTVIVKSPSGNYREIGGLESARNLAARNYGLVVLLLLASISPRFFPGFHHLQNMPQPVWVTVERA